MTERAASIATSHWASQFGCAAHELFAKPFRIFHHGPEFADYHGVFALYRGGAVMVTLPAKHAETLGAMLSSVAGVCSPESLAFALRPVTAKVIGPAWIGYAERVSPPPQPARALGPENVASLLELQHSCDAIDWEHGGSSLDHPCSGVFVDTRLASVAGYEVWGGAIAHISVITHPEFRGRGFGRSAVAHCAARALEAGLLPQYRTLRSNRPSIRVAESLGFQCYAESMAVRLIPAV